LEREQWLIPGLIRFNRWILIVAAFFIQMCIGSLYAFSGMNLPIETAIYGYIDNVDRGYASVTFYIATALLGCSAAAVGPWLERHGPYMGCIVGACLFYLGNLVAALGVQIKAIGLVYVGCGF
ncbi:UNVERIFIED_CONTAM: hypothetical protein HDU68_011292, partial [Siphonaria sp. JEL0065]